VFGKETVGEKKGNMVMWGSGESPVANVRMNCYAGDGGVVFFTETRRGMLVLNGRAGGCLQIQCLVRHFKGWEMPDDDLRTKLKKKKVKGILWMEQDARYLWVVGRRVSLLTGGRVGRSIRNGLRCWEDARRRAHPTGFGFRLASRTFGCPKSRDPERDP